MKYAIIGYPVEHSLSPLMHEAGFKALGLNAVYDRFPVTLAGIQDGINYLLEHNYSGWNVTYPLKEAIIPFLTELSPEARDIGAVNTVKVVKGVLLGHNTDGEGFCRSLSSQGFNWRLKKAVILGAGGAAKALAVALARRGVNILILNRTENKAEKLAKQIATLGGKAAWGGLHAGDWLQEVDLLIQTTPIGMQGEKIPIELRGIRPSAWVIDLIYKPAVTPFLAQAAFYGCKTLNGLPMLLYQGALAWEYWLGIKAPIEVMQKALEEQTRK
ncbi:MAG TPA: shikimate dehydrogenase [Peptococcaceae bacterium]|nr:shikimate dehydrogenase [Peptococcaceae bacterium]